MASQFHLQSNLDHLYTDQERKLAFNAQSPDEFRRWQQTLRTKILELLGIAGRTLPTEVKAERIQSVDRGDYVEEKYALDVGDGVYAPMYMLVPKTAPPFKVMLAFHGHDPSVQYILGNYPDEAVAQQIRAQDGDFAQRLAQAGYLVCAVEQRGFGERVSDQFDGNSCRHLSFEYLMQGHTMIGERCWDGMVALTYLQGRDDVVKGSIGCTGHSGGGTTTLWLAALDERISVAVVSCYFCSFKRSILGMYHCECNYVPGILEYAEMGDLAALIAPRPMRFIAGQHDAIYPVQGTQEQFVTVRRAYAVLDAADGCSLAVHPGEHGYNYAFSHEWFHQWL